jgi:hypothetical protein
MLYSSALRRSLLLASLPIPMTGATLLIAKLDRLSRDAHFLLDLQKAGVKFVAADMPEANELVVGLMSPIAQAERQMISARTKAALARAEARRQTRQPHHRGRPRRVRGGCGRVRAQRHGLRSSADDKKPRVLIDHLSMYLDKLPSVRVADMRRSGDLTPDMAHIAVTLQGGDGVPVSTEVGIVRIRMRSGGVFLQFICGCCGRRAQVLRLHAGRILCGRCTGLRYWCEGKPAVRRARHRIERLKAMRFHGGPVTRRPGRTMERRAELMASLRRCEAVVRRHHAGRIIAVLQADVRSDPDAAIPDR